VVGHEDIAGWRGKADPGALFDWPRFFADCYPGRPAPKRASVCPPDLIAAMRALADVAPRDAGAAGPFWNALSVLTETAVRLVQEAAAAKT
jgi:hypothetical protein